MGSTVEDVVRGELADKMTNVEVLAKNTLEAARKRYIERNPRSAALHKQALSCLPGGNSRTVLYSSPFPLSMISGKFYKVTDEDDHEYTDLVGEFSAGLYGHSEPVIRDAMYSAFKETGLNLGAHTRYEIDYASLLCARFGLERIRFANSGTEANLHALMAARYFTGKRKVVAFTGGYHGSVLSFGSEAAANTVNDADFIVVEYNNIDAATFAIEKSADVGAVLVEGMQGASGNIPGTEKFLQAIQASANKVGAVFILDEVLTSRLASGGLQTILGVKPDLTTLGKYLGGGLAFGAFGGRKDIMEIFDPRSLNGISHSGTFNNNTLTMRTGYAGLSKIYTAQNATTFNLYGDKLRENLRKLARGTKCCFTGRGSLIAVHFTKAGSSSSITSIADLNEMDDLKELFWLEMMENGFWISRRGSIAIMLGTPEVELERFVGCVGQFLSRHKEIVAVGR